MKAALQRLLLCGIAAFATHPAAAGSRYERAPAANGDFRITASYENVNRDPLSVAFLLPRQAVEASMQEFGFSSTEQQRIVQDCHCGQQELDQKLELYFRSRAIGSRMEAGLRHVYVDVPAVVRRNRPRLRDLALEFQRLAAARKYAQDEMLGAIIAFAQSALAYGVPPRQEAGRETLGFYPPMRALEAGLGDCDTKSALLAAILANFPGIRLIGVHVPKHYLLGISRIPHPGDAVIEYHGEPFVLIEASGPARLPPGMVGETTRAALATMRDIRIDPLF